MKPLIAGVVMALVLGIGVSPGQAHPLGPSSVDRLAVLELHPEMVLVRYTLDMASQTTERELPHFYADPKLYARRQAEALAKGLSLVVAGKRVALMVRSAEAVPVLDETGEPGLRLTAELRAPVHFTLAAQSLTFQDENYPVFKGKKQVQVSAQPSLLLENAPTAPVESLRVTVARTAISELVSVGLLASALGMLGLGIGRRYR